MRRKSIKLLIAVGLMLVLSAQVLVPYKSIAAVNSQSSSRDSNDVNADWTSLAIKYSEGDNANSVTKDLNLPSRGPRGCIITWKSSNESVITSKGHILTTAAADNASVTLTALVKKNSASKSKIFKIIVTSVVNIEAKKILTRIITPGMTDLEKEYAIYRYVWDNSVYDQLAYVNRAKPHSYDAYGPIIDGVGVCGGFSQAVSLLMNSVGIKTTIISGYDKQAGMDHAWNIVKIGDKYYHVDATQGKFNLNDDQVSSEGKSWNRKNYPACNAKPTYTPGYDFYIKGDWVYYLQSDDPDRNILYKVKADGTQKTKVCDLKYSGLLTAGCGDWIFYADRGSNPRIYKVKLDGTGDAIAYDFNEPKASLDSFAAYDTYVYCLTRQSDIYTLYKIDTEGKNAVKILESKEEYIKAAGKTKKVGSIYWLKVGMKGVMYETVTADGYQYCRVNFDGTDKKIVLSGK